MKKKTDPVRCLRLKRGSSALRELGRDSHPWDPGWGPEDVCAHHGCRPAALHTWFPILPASRRLLSTWWSAPLLLQRQRERERGGQKGREGESEREREREISMSVSQRCEQHKSERGARKARHCVVNASHRGGGCPSIPVILLVVRQPLSHA